jgi:hypothetical protein
MKKLIEALTIFLKYMENVKYPTHCEHDTLHVACDPEIVSKEDIDKLNELGFFVNEYGGFSSYRYGSC